MPTIPRRVVTGHDRRGVSVFADDGPVPVVRTAPDGAYFYEIPVDGGHTSHGGTKSIVDALRQAGR